MPLSVISALVDVPVIVGETPEAGLIVSVFTALFPAFGLIWIGNVSAGYVASVSRNGTGPITTRVLSAATAAVSVGKSPPVPTLNEPLIVDAPFVRPIAK